MSDEVETLIIGVRADTRAFAADVASMRASIDGPLADGAERAGRAIENALLRAARTGKLGFDDLKRVALSSLAEVARSALSAGIGSLSGSGGGAGAGLLGLASSLAASLFGAPGRAIGGPVSAGRPYIVGERGPELFVPGAAGRIHNGAGTAAARTIRITVNVGGNMGGDPQRMAASGRQIAQAVRRAVEAAGD